MFFVLIVLFAAASLFIDKYFSTATALNLIANNWYIVILGIGVTFLLVSGHLDMSVGGIVGMAGVLSAYFTQPANEGFSELGQGLGLPYGVAIVITSYSIHYTKLYDMVFSFDLMDIDSGKSGKWEIVPWNLSRMKAIIEDWQTALATGWNSLFWSNHDQPRPVSRFGSTASEELRVRS